MLTWLLPWEFSPTVLLATAAAALVYARGLARWRATGQRNGLWRPLSYALGLALIYAALQTRWDYYAQHMFFIHRLQHLALHHLGPFLIVLAAPWSALRRGLPQRLDRWLAAQAWLRGIMNVALDPWLAPLLFIAGVAIWLIPAVHFVAMLNADLYKLMNWSMVADGLPFWALVLDPRPQPPARLRYGSRILMLWLIMLPQIAIGAVIGLTRRDIFPVYAVCGRAFPVSPLTDQQIGGLIIWIPASMMSVVGSLILIRWMLRAEAAESGAPALD